eukprot:gb/GEZN01020931.1/.p1 GENE.gb/GEZN01020931.1/~~gb/GEZN01020931.1/.p1  ORF type:complete len:193 (+),score=11.43 gb/GEZN01020931.1/:16-594(+)
MSFESEQERNIVNTAKKEGSLRLAAYRGQRKKVKRLLHEGIELDAKDADGWTALMMASQYGRDECVRTLISARASVNAANELGETSLIKAAYWGKEACLRILLAGFADPLVEDHQGLNALAHAIERRASQVGTHNFASIVRVLEPATHDSVDQLRILLGSLKLFPKAITCMIVVFLQVPFLQPFPLQPSVAG